MSKVIPWSYSSLTNYENCPHKYYEVRIAKTTPPKTFSEADEGVQKHKIIERYLKGESTIVDKPLKRLVDNTLEALNPTYFKYEHKLAVTKDRQPCEWDDPNCYHRGVLDVMYVDPMDPVGRIFDWKNGKINAYSEQLKANSICVFAHYPHLKEVKTQYVWMKFGRTTPGSNHVEFMDRAWSRFVSRAASMEAALENNDWPKRPSGLCKKHCEVFTCEFNGSKNLG